MRKEPVQKPKVEYVIPGSICNDCAEYFKLKWPKGHCATFWQGECDQCGLDKGCCSTGDWNKAGGLKLPGMRD